MLNVPRFYSEIQAHRSSESIKPIEDLLEDLGSKKSRVRRTGLEGVIFELVKAFGLRFVSFRFSSLRVSGATIGVIADRDDLIFSRWQITGHDAKQLNLAFIAAEVGLALGLKSECVVIATTGIIANDARDYVDLVMQTSSPHLFLIDRIHLKRLFSRNRQATQEAMIRYTAARKLKWKEKNLEML